MDGTEAQIVELVERIRPLLADHAARVQGGVLADLLAIWLAGHIVPNDQRETDKLREEILRLHVQIVHQLIPPNARAIHGE